MEKLFSSLKVTDARLSKALTSLVHQCMLAKNETLPGGLPENTWVYVESGFIKKSIRRHSGIDVYDLLPEASCVLLTTSSSADEHQVGVCIEAIEPTLLYYLLPQEVSDLAYEYPSFGWEHMAFTMCAGEAMRERANIWLLPPADRLRAVIEEYPFLLRVGPSYLADYLRLTGREHSAVLAYFT